MSNTTQGFVFKNFTKNKLVESLNSIENLKILDYKFENIKCNFVSSNSKNVVSKMDFIGGNFTINYKGVIWQLLVTISYNNFDCYNDLSNFYNFSEVKRNFRINTNFKNSVTFILPYNNYSENLMRVILSAFSGVLLVDEYKEQLYYVSKV